MNKSLLLSFALGAFLLTPPLIGMFYEESFYQNGKEYSVKASFRNAPSELLSEAEKKLFRDHLCAGKEQHEMGMIDEMVNQPATPLANNGDYFVSIRAVADGSLLAMLLVGSDFEKSSSGINILYNSRNFEEKLLENKKLVKTVNIVHCLNKAESLKNNNK